MKLIKEATDDLNVDGYDIGFIGKGSEKDRPKHYVDAGVTIKVEKNLEDAIRQMMKVYPKGEAIETLIEIADEIKTGVFK